MDSLKTAARTVPARAAAIFAVAIAVSAAAFAPGAAAAEDNSMAASKRVIVEVDRAQIMRLDDAATSIIVGNPLIADAAVHDQNMIIITGKSFGTTNMIVLDYKGNEVMSRTLEVREREDAVVTMHKGTGRMSYSCSPNCEPTLLAGDSPDYFNSVRDRIVSRNEVSSGAAK